MRNETLPSGEDTQRQVSTRDAERRHSRYYSHWGALCMGRYKTWTMDWIMDSILDFLLDTKECSRAAV